jgi:hypothetical protein
MTSITHLWTRHHFRPSFRFEQQDEFVINTLLRFPISHAILHVPQPPQHLTRLPTSGDPPHLLRPDPHEQIMPFLIRDRKSPRCLLIVLRKPLEPLNLLAPAHRH